MSHTTFTRPEQGFMHTQGISTAFDLKFEKWLQANGIATSLDHFSTLSQIGCGYTTGTSSYEGDTTTDSTTDEGGDDY